MNQINYILCDKRAAKEHTVEQRSSSVDFVALINTKISLNYKQNIFMGLIKNLNAWSERQNIIGSSKRFNDTFVFFHVLHSIN